MNATILNYRSMPDAVRLASAEVAVSMIEAGMKLSEVSRLFATSSSHVNEWVKLKSTGKLGKRLHHNRHNKQVDMRTLPYHVRMAVRSFAVLIASGGGKVSKIAHELGTTQLSVRRWIDEDSHGIRIERKRGRKKTYPTTGLKI